MMRLLSKKCQDNLLECVCDHSRFPERNFFRSVDRQKILRRLDPLEGPPLLILRLLWLQRVKHFFFFPSSFFSDNTGLFIGQGATARLSKGGGGGKTPTGGVGGLCAGRGWKKNKKWGIARSSFLHFLFLSFFLSLWPPLSHLVEVLEKEFDQYDWQEEERKEGRGERKNAAMSSFLPFFLRPPPPAGA